MKHPKSWKQRLNGYLSLEYESLPLQSLLELCGDKRVLIENHAGIIEYGPERISVRVRYGVVSVIGKSLRLCKMQSQQLVIFGRIDRIELTRRKA